MSAVFGFQNQITERKFMPLEFRKQRVAGPRNLRFGALAANPNHLLVPLIAALSVSVSVLAVPVPVPGQAPVPVERLRPGNPAVLPMTGTWRFNLERGDSPAVEGVLPADTPVPAFASPSASDAGWSNIPVPANWEIEGFSMLTYQERPVTSHDIGLYRRWVDVPASFAGQRVLWHFDGAYDGAEVFVNGQRCGYHESGFTAFNIDVTSALKPGQSNLMAVRLYKDTSSAALDHGDFWCLGGIYRETYLVALPPLHVEDVTVVTDLDAQYKDATLKSTVRVAGPAGIHFVLTGELYSLDGSKIAVPAMSQAGDIGADGAATVALTAPVTAPKLWSAEKPNLYYVFYRLSDGNQTVERVQDRIGFRKVELKNGVFEVNGVPVKFTGTCRHEEYSPYGHALTEQCWETDTNLMKACNINAIRTSHYNHAERFLEMCDEAGFYVLDEVPSCWVASEIHNATRTWAYVFRSKETFARDKNRACVVIWSCGNESSYGINNQAEFDYMKANDPTRLALISQVNLGQSPRVDFEDYHLYPYPSPQELGRYIASPNRAKVPIILTEYGSGTPAELANTWNIIWSTDAIVGATIWEWQAQGMYDKFPERWSIPAPGARTDTTTGYRTSGGQGPTTADRQITPLYWNMKMAHSPVSTTNREIALASGKCVVPLQNRYSFTDLSELTCNWQTLAGEKLLSTGESHIAAKPRSSVDASFPATPGMDTLRLEFFDPYNRSVYVTRLHTKDYQGPAAPAALAAAGPVRLSETDQNVTVQTAGTELVLDKSTGQITSWRAGGQDIVLGGPILNLGDPAGGGRRGGGGGGGGGGRGRGGPIFVNTTQAPQLRNAVVTAKMDGPDAKIAVAADVYLPDTNELKGQLSYTLDIGPDAQASLTWNLAWKAADVSAREAGLKFLLPATADHMSWYNESVWTEYPPGHADGPQGSATSREPTFSSVRRDVHWLTVSGSGDDSLVALATGQPLHTHGRVQNNGVTLYLSSATVSADAPGNGIRLTQATPLTGGFRLRVAAKAK
jgi:beta-galactosidase